MNCHWSGRLIFLWFDSVQGIVGCGVSFVLLTWCIEKRGPVFVAAFIPVVQIIVSVIDFAILQESLYLGRYTYIYLLIVDQTKTHTLRFRVSDSEIFHS